MIDVVDPRESFSVSDFERIALPILNDIIGRGKVPILCGGTGFYMNALLYRSSFGNTPADSGVREKYEKIEREMGREYLHGLLVGCDPESASKLHPNDVKRVIRALEIYELTGRKKSEQHDKAEPRFPFIAVAFDYPREELYGRIDRRVDEMFSRGLVEEVEELLKSGIAENALCMQGIGYREIVDSLKNDDSQCTMRDIIKQNTRNYAKRQLTFFKKYQNLHWLTPKSIAEAAEETLKLYGD